MDADGRAAYRDDVGPARRSWLGSALLRLLFAGVAVLASHLYLQEDVDGPGAGGRSGWAWWPPRGRDAVCAAFAALGAVLVLTLQAELGALLSPRSCPWDWVAGRRQEDGSQQLHPGDLLESWMFEAMQEAAPAAGQDGAVVTRPVFARLEGSVLTVWSCRPGAARVPRVARTALWSEDEAVLLRARADLTHRRRYLLQGATVTLLPDGLSSSRRWSRKYPICVTASVKLAEEETSPSTSSTAEVTQCTPAAPAEPEATHDMPSIVVSAASASLSSSAGRSAAGSQEDASPSVDTATCASERRVSTPKPTPPTSHSGSPTASATRSPTAATPTISPTSLPSACPSPKPSQTVTASASKEARASSSSNGSNASDLSVNFADVSEVRDVEDVEERLLGGIMSEEIVGLGDDDVAADEMGPASAAAPATALLLLARTARQKEEWYWRLLRATGEPQPLDDAAFLEDYVASLRQYLDDAEADKPAAEAEVDPSAYQGLNALAGRVLLDACRSARWAAALQAHAQKRMASFKVPTYMEQPVVSAVHSRHAAVRVLRVGRPCVDAQGLWVDLDVSYRGVVRFVITSRLNLTSQARPAEPRPAEPRASGPEPASATGQDDAGTQAGAADAAEPLPGPALPPMLQPRSGTWRIFKRLAESRFFQAALSALSTTDLVLVVEVRALDGVLCVHVPPPPSDRVWLGFRGVPCLRLVTAPRLGGRSLRHALLCRLIERRLRAHMERVLVLPNMTNVVLPFT